MTLCTVEEFKKDGKFQFHHGTFYQRRLPRYEELTLLNYVTAQSGQRRIPGSQMIQHLLDKSQQQHFS